MVTISYQRRWRTGGGLCLAAFLLALTFWVGRQAVNAQSTQTPQATATQSAVDQLAAQLLRKGNLPVIVELAVPGYDPAAFAEVQAASVQEAAIATVQTAVLDRLAGHNPTNVKTYPYVPYLALTVASDTALAALAADPLVVRIVEDIAVPPLLDESVPLQRADDAHGIFYRGNGVTVAVLDTGVAKNHPDLVGKVVAEACYSTNNPTCGAVGPTHCDSSLLPLYRWGRQYLLFGCRAHQPLLAHLYFRPTISIESRLCPAHHLHHCGHQYESGRWAIYRGL